MGSLPCRANYYPTRNFATLGTLVTTLRGALLRPTRGARSFLPSSPCRHGGRTVPLPSIRASKAPGVQSLRIPSKLPQVSAFAACRSHSYRRQDARFARTLLSSGALCVALLSRLQQRTENHVLLPVVAALRRTGR